MIVMLDSGVLGRLARPEPDAEIDTWFVGLIQRGRKIVVPEVCDFEVRRSFLLNKLERSLSVLDGLPTEFCEYLPITTNAMREAARLWANARAMGVPTADDRSLDADCILAGQAVMLEQEESRPVVIATTNARHLERYAPARNWADVT